MKNLLSMDEVSTEEIMTILNRAAEFEAGAQPQLEKEYFVANLFFEPSTRTKTSFEVAERRVGATVIPFDTGFSSVLKGETLYDTVKTIQQSGIDAVVIRHKQDAYYEELLEGLDVAIVNAGDGAGQHPSQSLLDLYTIYKEFGRFEGVQVTIAGDISHSRVAKSDAIALEKLGADVHFVCPPEWQGEFNAQHEWDQQIETSDVIMLLRVQHERDAAYEGFTTESYHAQYGLTVEREKQMKDGAIIMHPAPINRGVEIDSSLVECERSRIFAQMKNGLYIRMAIMEQILKGRD
ncbi:MAG: aspartate carbamoyltransferase catalytic subunit [Kurthia gibsonii]|uniref:aspartate carbamoyltransferase catalytic subunit n=1 Tax=Kurthia TaxID=1649 RepID=UPI0011423548|nr:MULTISPECIES: aspartate carbamoyltransferase catalytic subunit [Kurthia]MCA9723884.1 aspartate carbamoyltransferase catalytic subunit [Kurthia sp.]MEB6111801.1 aspartate carbamoyltransferase catalytic subunit [Kurthia gibsonii]MEB7771691.1 aspartate carbamoyltransferase catalytic subunit [Kurthia gibsonii]WIL39318.1 aspartate carbamoyltransferase catalytic subunit [Kurthia sp. YJT4]GED18593.1 aspartate carbamoyltransferase [Kurthia gibsonii]